MVTLKIQSGDYQSLFYEFGLYRKATAVINPPY